MLKPAAGTYAIILRSHTKKAIRVGQWGMLRMKKGFYIYVGSAFGPGGLRARVLRHCLAIKPIHWHIDYLRSSVCPIEVIYSHDAVKLEHQWARGLMEMRRATSILGFGSSDCKCEAHLFFTPDLPSTRALAKSMKGQVHCEVLA